MTHANEIDVAVAAVRSATRVCREVQLNLVAARTVQKEDRSPVTVADFAAQAVICAMLREHFPDLPVVGEEESGALRGDSADALGLRARVAQFAGLSVEDTLRAIDHGGYDPAATSPRAARYWALDPIDGTKGFLRGQQYAVALALIEGGQVVLGVLGCPNLGGQGLLMAATRDGGARQLLLDGSDIEGEPLNPPAIDDPAQARFCESVEPGHSDQDASRHIADDLGITRPPCRIDSQCKYAALARGDAAIYLRLPTRPGYREKIWDHAAGLIVVREAGGMVSDVAGKPLDFSHGRQLDANRGVVATTGGLHEQVIEAVKRHVRVTG